MIPAWRVAWRPTAGAMVEQREDFLTLDAADQLAARLKLEGREYVVYQVDLELSELEESA